MQNDQLLVDRMMANPATAPFDLPELVSHSVNHLLEIGWTFYTWKAIHNAGSADASTRQALNATPAVWSVILSQLQQGFVIGLGRIFDQNPKSLSLDVLLKTCEDQISEFSRAALRRRRLADLKQEPPWLQSYVDRGYEATVADIRDLQAAAAAHQATFKSDLQPLRHKLMAHKDLSHLDNPGALFKVTIGTIEGLIDFCWQVYMVLQELLSNGHKTALSAHAFGRHDEIEQQVDKLLAKLTTP